MNQISNLLQNKLKSLKVAQVKDEMDDDEDDGYDIVSIALCTLQPIPGRRMLHVYQVHHLHSSGCL